MKPLQLRFREEPGMGYPFVLDVSEEAKVQTEPREIKDKDTEEAVDNTTPTVHNYTQLYTITILYTP